MIKIDIDKLRELKNLEKEIELLRRMITENKNQCIIDGVTGSDTEFPYTSRRIQIEGIDFDEDKKLNKKLKSIIDRLETEKKESLEMIYNIDNSVARQIFILKYMEGLNWDKISEKVCYSKTNVRNIHRKYINRDK